MSSMITRKFKLFFPTSIHFRSQKLYQRNGFSIMGCFYTEIPIVKGCLGELMSHCYDCPYNRIDVRDHEMITTYNWGLHTVFFFFYRVPFTQSPSPMTYTPCQLFSF